MKVQYDNKVMTSLMLYVDHKMCHVGEAFINHSGYLYDNQPSHLYKDGSYNYYVYTAPHKQLVADYSITGAQIPSGIYVDGIHYGVGLTGPRLQSINHQQGHFYTRTAIAQTSSTPRQSAYYSVKEFNTYLTSMPEERLLFETKIDLRPKVTNPTTGLQFHDQTYPAIFLKNMGGVNTPFEFGGTNTTSTNVRAMVLSDSAFSLDAVCSIFKDCTTDLVPFVGSSDLPFDALGGSPSGYHYANLATSKVAAGQYLYIDDIVISRNVTRGYTEGVNPQIQAGFIDFVLHNQRQPSQAAGRKADITGTITPGY